MRERKREREREKARERVEKSIDFRDCVDMEYATRFEPPNRN